MFLFVNEWKVENKRQIHNKFSELIGTLWNVATAFEVNEFHRATWSVWCIFDEFNNHVRWNSFEPGIEYLSNIHRTFWSNIHQIFYQLYFSKRWPALLSLLERGAEWRQTGARRWTMKRSIWEKRKNNQKAKKATNMSELLIRIIRSFGAWKALFRRVSWY